MLANSEYKENLYFSKIVHFASTSLKMLLYQYLFVYLVLFFFFCNLAIWYCYLLFCLWSSEIPGSFHVSSLLSSVVSPFHS